MRVLSVCSLLIVVLGGMAGCAGYKPKPIKEGKEIINPYVKQLIPTKENRPDNKDVITYYALGDWGTGEPGQSAVAKALKEEIDQLPQRNIAPFVVGLGDNFYDKGLPDKRWGDKKIIREIEQKFGNVYDDVLYDSKNVFFHVVPGNHDYGRHFDLLGWFKGSYGNVLHQETTAESLYSWFKYYPMSHPHIPDSNDEKEYELLKEKYRALKKNGIDSLTFPQKIEVKDLKEKGVLIVAIDTQVILDLYDGESGAKTARDAHNNHLSKLLKQEAQWKIVFGHHPLRTFGPHGSAKRGRAELTEQDVKDNAYQEFIKEYKGIFKNAGVQLYIAGHEHSLQFFSLGPGLHSNLYQLVSGSAAKKSNIRPLDDDYLYLRAGLGFVRLDLTDDAMWIQFFGRQRKIAMEECVEPLTTFRVERKLLAHHETVLLKEASQNRQ